jgi:hypothetical protein
VTLSGDIMKRLSINKKEHRKSDTDRFHLKKLNCVEFKEQYQLKISKYNCSFGKFKG